MADIELVIKISEKYYKAITEISNHQCTADMLIIKNGTPLPKGHGNLIDQDKIEFSKTIHDAIWERISWSEAIKQIKYSAPTVIKADESEET